MTPPEHKLLNTIKNATKRNPATVTDLVWGVVTSIDPLKIKVDNRFEITEDFIVLSALCQEAIIKIPTEAIVQHLHIVPQHSTQAAGDPSHTHVINSFSTELAMPEIRLWRGLIIGDNVRMLRINNGQTYFVMEREEGISWYPTTEIT